MSEQHNCVPPGWKLVPINLTPQQLTAISRAYWDGGNPEDRVLDARVMYGAALAAAPVATQAAAPRAQLIGWWDTTQPAGFRWKDGIVRGDFADETPVYAGALPGAAQSDERAAWEYNFIHSSATGRGDMTVGPCLTYDRAVAYGVGCIDQREVLVSSARDTAPQAAPISLQQLRAEVRSVMLDFSHTRPEEGETWESWYEAAFDMAGSRIYDLFEAAGIHADPARATHPTK